MGLRTELQVDGDKCRSCGSLLAIEGIALDRHNVIENDMAITMVEMLCCRCFAVTEIPYFGELLPSELMQEFLMRLPGKREVSFAHAGRG